MYVVQQGGLADYAVNLEPFINQIPDYAFYMLDAAGRIISWNAGAQRLKGYSAQEIIGCNFSVFFTAEDLATGKPQHALEIASRDGAFQEEGLRVRKDGTTFWATVSITALRDQEGKLQGFAKVTRDITERKAAEAALREREAKYRALYEHSNDAIFLTRPGGAVLAANPAACALFGYSEQELTSLRREQMLYMMDARSTAAIEQRAATGVSTAELTLIRKGGERFEARVTSKVFTDETGQEMTSTIIQDITERKQAEEVLRQSEERFRLLYENAPVGIAHIDLNGRWTFANRKFAEIIGYPLEEVVGLSYLDVTPPEERAVSNELKEKLLSGEIDTIKRERRLLRKDGSKAWTRLTASIIRDEAGKPQSGIAVFEDIAERRQAEEALQQSEAKFRTTFEYAPLGVAECTLEGRYIEVNSKLLDILGYTRDEILRLSVMDVTHPIDVEETLSNLRKMVAGEIDSYVVERRCIRKDRSLVWVDVTTSLMRVEGKPQYIIAAIEDITARKKAEEDLKRAMEVSYQQANHDLLTGLANRARFNDRLKEALDYAKRDGHLVAIHLLDLDRFKSINDTLGHHVGDLLLKDVAKRIKSTIRSTDVAARLGGDEFVVIQTHLAEPSAANVLARKLVDELGRKYVLEDQEVYSGTSIGIALFPNNAEDPEELFKQADLALYDAKHRGRFNFQLYREELGAAFREAQRLEKEMERALRENEFCLYYQPQFDLKDGRITGIEALLRWCHPTKGLLDAAVFIQNAERASLMLQIGQWALQTACRQHKEWTDAGLAIPLTLNLSSKQLRDPRLLQVLGQILKETALPPHFLQLEMRESMLWEPRFSDGLLSKMKESGVRLGLDNFGTEMTALSTLNRFPLDAVKPGRGLVKELPSHKREAAILAAIIGVAHNLKIEVCADGVENANQLAAVKEQGCDSAQGYLLSSPLDTEGMQRLIEIELAH